MCVFQSDYTTYISVSNVLRVPIHPHQYLLLSDLKILMSQMGENGISFYFAFLRLIKFKIFPHVDWPCCFMWCLCHSPIDFFLSFSLLFVLILYTVWRLIYFGYISGKYLFPARGLYFHSLKGVCWWTEVLNFGIFVNHFYG